ncbi:hypothetical protein D9615_002644 [Tricholomella constricta]|uniref:Rho-GAP domain-containing protein n=1 Tax=Tricholomella constricta TaxID=117010 RepID=A0A8H5M9Q3_9AGAR|nr:hypothetical protein D9615_002644 [Tricholomella constricta]
MLPGSDHSAASNLVGSSLWPSETSAHRARPSSSTNQLTVTTNIPPRSASLAFTAAMGQSFSKSNTATLSPSGPPPSPSTAQRGLTAAMAGGMRLKRAFASRGKKSVDAGKTVIMDRSISQDETSEFHQHLRQQQQQRIQTTPSSSSSPAQVIHPSSSSHDAAHPRRAKHLTQLATQVFSSSSRKLTKPSLQQRELPPPPQPPPKPVLVPEPQPQTPARPPPLKSTSDFRSSIIPISPGISDAVNYIRMEARDAQNIQEHVVEDNRWKAKEEAKKKETKEKEKETEAGQRQGADPDKGDSVDKGELKDLWRKSDSTMSHHTIRPGGRPSRPVSMAESLQSNHTIVPVNKRQSALITDADFGMPEEDDSDGSVEDSSHSNDIATSNTSSTTATSTSLTPNSQHTGSPTPSIKARDRRSMSLNISTHAAAALAKHRLPPTPSSASAANLTHSLSEHSPHISPPAMSVSPSPSYSRDGPPPTAMGSSSSAPRQIRHNNNNSNSNNPYTTFPPPPEPTPIPRPASRLDRDRTLPALPAPPRQPALSMTGGLGLAAKRAVERMGLGRAWGLGLHASPTPTNNANVNANVTAGLNAHHGGGVASGYSSGASGNASPAYGGGGKHGHGVGIGHGYSSSASSAYELTRTSSGQSSSHQSGLHQLQKPRKHAAHAQLHHRKHTNAPSISSVSTSASDVEGQEARTGPNLGKRLRGPLRSGVGAGRGGGVVFGRELRSVVRETGVGVGKPRVWGGRWRNWDGGEEAERGVGGAEEVAGEGQVGEKTRSRKGSVKRGQLKALEERKLPALVVRCAQHLLIWGVQEEGLFRVPGRAFHVSKLRAEFDSGGDFDMAECSPGDLDPHAVASVFKAFLRELPEPILTNALLPYFDGAMMQENTTNASKDTEKGDSTRARSNSRGPGLPSNPRSSTNMLALHKPPSLTTLAMPRLTGLPPPSDTLRSTFQMLLAQLPEENRDLIRTVTELIRATAHDSVATKMPLSNLLLVFCPSLNMSPSLLRVLCEAEGIWEEVPVVVPKEEDVVLDIRKEAEAEAVEVEVEEAAEEEFDDAREDAAEDGERESVLSVSVGRTSEDVPSSVEYHASTEDVVQRHAVAKVYLDVGDDRSSISPPVRRQAAHTRKGSVAASSLGDDGSSYLSTSEDHENPSRHYSDVHSQSISPPLLTSSAESLDTPATSSHHASLPHLPFEDGFKALQAGASSPRIAELSPMGLSSITPRRPVISNPIPITGPVQFPSSTTSENPPSPSKVDRRRSIPLFSLPSLSPNTAASGDSDLPSPTLSLAGRAKRLKKPSLHLLFSKKSSSSLSSPRVASSPSTSLRPVISSPYMQTPRSASDSSVSTPLSAVTAPQSSTFTLPPQLDTPIENSPLRFGMGLGLEVVETPATPQKEKERENEKEKEEDKQPLKAVPAGPRPLPTPPVSALQQGSASVTSLVPPRGPTPIADRYYRPGSPAPSLSLSLSLSLASKSQLSVVTPHHESETAPAAAASHLRPNPTSRSRGMSTSSNASSNHLGLMDDDEPEEDWTRSVLLAADVEGGWALEMPAAARG